MIADLNLADELGELQTCPEEETPEGVDGSGDQSKGDGETDAELSAAEMEALEAGEEAGESMTSEFDESLPAAGQEQSVTAKRPAGPGNNLGDFESRRRAA